MKEVDLYSVNISLDADRVLLIKFKDGADVDVEKAEQIMKTSFKLVNKKRFYLITDARDIHGSIDHSSRKYMSEHEVNNLSIAQAIVVNNMPLKLIANFYLKFYKHNQPMRVFSNIEKARKWVLSKD